MLSLSCADPWPEGSVGLEEEVVTAGDPASIGMPLTPGKPTAAAYSRLQSFPGIVAHGHCPSEVDYKTNAHIKPPYSYATLICMAMQASKKTKITLSCIYKWITDNFCYYRHADPTWQNSIRHNLSLNKCFIKVPRQKDEPGKGGFWKIDPLYAERLLSGAYKKRQLPPVQINPALQNRFRVNVLSQSRGPCSSTGGQSSLRIKLEPKHLREYEEATGADQNWAPHLAEGTMLGSWPVVKGSTGHKRKRSLGLRRNAIKVPRRSSSPLLSVDEQKDIGPLKGNFDWDSLLDSALNGELSLDGEVQLSPIPKEEDLTVRGTQICPTDPHMLAQRNNEVSGFDEETYLAAAFLESPWSEEVDQGHNDFLCSSNVNLDQLFDLGDSLGGDSSAQIDSLL
ncbi:hypothetical protein LDENG_00003710 [Lucifuga dentata]|nr:hypothetical protein LDENG_00003710 [Lucifuga dentata]